MWCMQIISFHIMVLCQHNDQVHAWPWKVMAGKHVKVHISILCWHSHVWNSSPAISSNESKWWCRSDICLCSLNALMFNSFVLVETLKYWVCIVNLHDSFNVMKDDTCICMTIWQWLQCSIHVATSTNPTYMIKSKYMLPVHLEHHLVWDTNVKQCNCFSTFHHYVPILPL